MIQFTRTANPAYGQMVSLDEAVGFLPHYWDATDPTPAVAQHDAMSPPGGPWSDFSNGFRYDPVTEALQYPGDPDLLPLAFAVLPLSRERILVYPSAWVAIVQDDGTYTVDRRD